MILLSMYLDTLVSTLPWCLTPLHYKVHPSNKGGVSIQVVIAIYGSGASILRYHIFEAIQGAHRWNSFSSDLWKSIWYPLRCDR